MSSLLNLKTRAKLMFSGKSVTDSTEIIPNPQRISDSPQEDLFRIERSHIEGAQELNSSGSSSGSWMNVSQDSSTCVQGVEENALADDQDGFLSQQISGTLTFAENPSSPSDSKDFVYEVPCDGTASQLTKITFEVISAEVIREGKSGHVIYTVLINPHKDSAKISPTVIKRRYSDFENLHQMLRKKFPSIMSHISFPRKVLIGNFTSEIIAKRSTAFEQYLTHLYSIFEVRYSRDFMEFFIQGDLRASVDFFLAGKFSNSIPLLERIVPRLEKLYGNFHILVCQCLCSLVVCYIELDKLSIAHSCAEVALKCCLSRSSAADDELRCAVLSVAIRLCWKLGLDKRELETKLEAMQAQGIKVDTGRDLKEVLMKTFQTSLPR